MRSGLKLSSATISTSESFSVSSTSSTSSTFMSSSATSSASTSSTATLSTTTSLTTTTSIPSVTPSTSITLPTSSEPISPESTSRSRVESRSQSESQSTFLTTSLPTSNTVSESTPTPATSTSAGSSLLSSPLTTTTTSSTETSTIVTSASTENPSSETSTSETTISSSSTASEVSLSSTGQTTTGTESTVLSTQQQTSPITSAPASGSSTSPSLTTSTTSSTPSKSPKNIQVLNGYDFIACLRSDEGFPTFTEVATQADMTTEICVKLAAGSIYVGVYEQTCYKADSLAGSEVVEDARCSLLFPGDPALFCGGTTGGAGRRRAIPSNRLLTIYRQSVSSSSSSSSSASSSQASQASVTRTLPSTSKSNAATNSRSPVSSSSISSRKTTVSPTISELSLISGTPSPVTSGPIRTIHVTKGVTGAEIVIAETVTTVTHVTLNPSQPGAITTTCIALTMQYTACGCDHQEYSPVDMTTIISPCQVCGYQGQDVVIMVVPVAACESGSVNYRPSGWIGGEARNNGYPDRIQDHQIYTGSEGDVNSQPQPTQGQQNGEGLGYENGSSDIEAATQASGGRAPNKQPGNLQPSQGQKSGKVPDYQIELSSTKAAAQGPGDEAQKTANPLPTQGQQNIGRPGDENGQSAVAVQTSPGHKNKNGPIASASQSSNALNPSKPVHLPKGQQVSSDGLTRETSGVPAPQPDNLTSPYQLVPVHGHHPAISTTFATEIEVTKEVEASESTHRFSALEPGEASSVSSMVSSSEAYSIRIMDCSMIFVIVGVVLLL